MLLLLELESCLVLPETEPECEWGGLFDRVNPMWRESGEGADTEVFDCDWLVMGFPAKGELGLVGWAGLERLSVFVVADELSLGPERPVLSS